MRAITILFSLAVVFLVLKVVEVAGRVDHIPAAPPAVGASDSLQPAVDRLNQYFRRRWAENSVPIAGFADDLTVYRRLSLALFGTVPSLEDVRSFEADSEPGRIDRWVVRMLQDSRYSDYIGERLARSLVGVEEGPFIIFRRDRLTTWLAEQLRNDAPWSRIATDLIASEGLWTDRPASNFITVARIADETIDRNKLAGRTVRTFLGQRIDCAQCHDHPFDPRWKQKDFEGLTAFYCQVGITVGGVTDSEYDDQKQKVVYKVVDPGKGEDEARIVPEAVPFSPEWLPQNGGLRQRLAAWVTHRDNRRFERAISNRIWGLLFGKPLHEPVDDLPHPEDHAEDALDILGQEFRSRDDRLSVLIRIIAQSEVFRLSSESSVDTEDAFAEQVAEWSVFPLVRLRPEQIIGSLFQAGHVRTIDQNSNVIVRLQKFGNENDFLREYGDLGDDELLQQVGTIPQALLRMNGRFSAELSKVDLLTSPGQILRFSKDDPSIIEHCFLTCLTRRPEPEEQQHFLSLLQESPTGESTDTATPDSERPAGLRRSREEVVQDIFWTLFNSPEFSWNH